MQKNRLAYYTAMISKMEVNRSSFIDNICMFFIDIVSTRKKTQKFACLYRIVKMFFAIYFFQIVIYYHDAAGFSI
jgi:hypothetical protein